MQASDENTIAISGLNALELRALRKLLPENTVRVPSTDLEMSQHGDLGTTTAIVVLGALSIKALASWLVQHRQKNRIKFSRVKINSDGSSETHEWFMEGSSSDSESEVLKQLLTGLRIDSRTLPGT
jgi:hypothetical protein